MLRLRNYSLALAAAAVLASCAKSQPTPAVAGRATGAGPAPAGAVVLGTFEGTVDPVAGKMTIGAVQASPSAALPAALSVIEPYQDGIPGSGPASTFELVTETTPSAPGVESLGCGSVDSFNGWITLRSFYTTQTFWNVYVELSTLSPTGYEGCNGDAAFADLGTKYGLWRYGTIGPHGSADPNAPDHVSKQWKFMFGGQPFNFTGRIMAMPGPEFDWTPASITTPVRKFREVATTTGHFLWDGAGAGFVDEKGSGITFVAAGGPVRTASNGLTATLDPYADLSTGTSTGTYYVASVANGASKIDTSGDFTVCARFKPGAHPGTSPTKVIVGKGSAEGAGGIDQGWSLVQWHTSYSFRYLSSTDITGNTWSSLEPGWDGGTVWTTNPETWAFDYVCGGRNSADPLVGGPGVMVGVHGKWRGLGRSVTGTLTNDSSLPLVIGAYPAGSSSAYDAGVYEVIFDRRPASPDVMNEIVSLAEGRTLPNELLVATTAPAATYLEPFWATTPVLGFDGNTYQFAPYLTAPYASDGSGLLPPGVQVQYTRPFTENTGATGYCVAADVAADGGWGTSGSPAVTGSILQFGNQAPGVGYATMYLSAVGKLGFVFNSLGVYTEGGDVTAAGWASGSTHRLMTCVDPAGSSNFKLYLDPSTSPTPVATWAVASPFNPGDPSAMIGIGNAIPGGSWAGGLSGGRIARVIFCPSNNPVLCQ